ncbi:MAG: patatin-like phospholipase family protein [Robiginitalea sp.]|uniref:patatin-like phospholipase family protein n=1 Tax=Robiginitalea sp. TaxID=1902411 RepID=UPI003C7260C0
MNIENLVFKGGGVLGAAYAGAIMALEENKKLEGVKAIAGTSAGSLVALLISLKYSAEDIKRIVFDTDFKDFKDGWNPLRIPRKYGLYKGHKFLSTIKSVIEEKTGNPNLTYKELYKKGYRDLRVFATDLNISDVREFSYRATPKVNVAESIRASISIPLFFKAWQFTDKLPDDHIYVDGGLVYIYPFTDFKDDANTLGFYLSNNKKPHSNLGFNQIFDYLKLLYKATQDAQEIDFHENSEIKERTVLIDDFGISTTDFKLCKSQKEKLYASGKKATLDYLKNH